MAYRFNSGSHWSEQCKDRSNKQQDQTDHPQGLWLPDDPEHDGYGVSGMLKYQGTTSEPKK